jgi:cytochrome c
MRKLAFTVALMLPFLLAALPLQAQTFGTAAEARAMLDKAVAALKANEADAIVKFNAADGGFRDRDLYVFTFDMSTGKFTAHPSKTLMGTDIRALKVKDDPLGQRIFDTVKEGQILTVDYMFPKPSGGDPVPKQSFVTRVGNVGAAVGYYK